LTDYQQLSDDTDDYHNRVVHGLGEQLVSSLAEGASSGSCPNKFSCNDCKYWRFVSQFLLSVLKRVTKVYHRYFWPSSWGPSYVKSYLLCILMAVIALVILRPRYRSYLEEANKAAEEDERLKGLPKGFRYLL
jgi:hypothetical protein